MQIFKGHLRREGIIPELIIYTVLDISIELKSKQKMDNNNVKNCDWRRSAPITRPPINRRSAPISGQSTPTTMIGADTKLKKKLVGADQRRVGDCTLCPFAQFCYGGEIGREGKYMRYFSISFVSQNHQLKLLPTANFVETIPKNPVPYLLHTYNTHPHIY